MRRIFTSLFFLLTFLSLNAQNAPKSRIEGTVYESEDKALPLEHATISLYPAEIHTVSNVHGNFSFENVNAGNIRIVVRFIGMQTIDTLVNISTGSANRFVFRMKIENFRMEEVFVTAKQNKVGQSTSSTISRQAIDHVQAVTLSDLMQFIPGTVLSNPGLNTENRVSLRTIPVNDDSYLVNSLGTAIIMDGAQLSNNANLQALAPTLRGNTGGAIKLSDGSTGNIAGGVDTRTLALDNIESVEIIRGVPSAEYGDLTSGAIIIKSRAGRDPLRARFKTNPELYQGSLSKGFSLGEKAGNMNVNVDYLYNVKSPVTTYAFYQRFAGRSLWSKTFGQHLHTNTSLELRYGKDTRKDNPDDKSIQLRNSSSDLGFTFNTNGRLNVNYGWLKSVEYVLAGSYTDKHTWEEERLISASSIYATTTVDGATVSNYPGMSIFDDLDNEITNIVPGSENDWSTFLPNEYLTRWDIYGKEMNVNAKIKADFSKTWGDIVNRIVVGADFKTDGNVGKGKVYDDTAPPLRSGSYAAYRPRAYSDIPFINQIGVFIEDRYSQDIGERELKVSAGGRFDYINNKMKAVPRANASFEIIPKKFNIRGGYGLTAKAPTLVYLYPENAYFDYPMYVNINDPNNIFTLIKTRVFTAENPDLEIATNRKAEAGFDLRIADRYRLSVTAYDELIKNGYSLGYNINKSFNLIEYNEYRLVNWNAGQMPVLYLNETSNIFAAVQMPMNNLYNRNRGIEFELDLGHFEAIKTSFLIDGAWMRRTTKSTSCSFITNSRPGYKESNIGVYDPGRTASEREQFLTTARAIHHIPSVGFVVTLTGQAIWTNKDWSKYNTDTFSKYISYKDGEIYDYDPSMNDDPEFKYLINPIDPNREKVEKAVPVVFFNINVSKEIGTFLTASFFANNMFFNRPIYESTRTPGTFRELGSNLFFGFDLKVTIR